MYLFLNNQNIILSITKNYHFFELDQRGLLVITKNKNAKYIQDDTFKMFNSNSPIKTFYDVARIVYVNDTPKEIKPLEYTYDDTKGFEKYNGQIVYTDKMLSEKADEIEINSMNLEDALCEVAESQTVKNEELEDAICEIYEMLGE